MKEKINSLREKFYFLPSVYAFVFMLFAAFIAYMDKTVSPFDTGTGILMTVVGLMATLLTVSFSIIMIVLTLYGNQLSPRTLQDFLEKKITQITMGYYTGALVFSITSLLLTLMFESGAMISSIMALVFLIAGIMLFVFFMHYISKQIQSTIFIQNIVEEADALLTRKATLIDEDPLISSESADKHAELLSGEAFEITLGKSGFIRKYNETGLLELADEGGVVLFFERKVGEHAMEDSVVVKVFGHESINDKEDFTQKIREMIKTGDEPNIENIYDKTHKLVEIAVRALSPGINDPATAEFCIEKIGFLLQRAARISESKVYRNETGDVRLILKGITFKNLLFEHFYQIKLYGINDLKIHNALITALNGISKDANYSIRKQIWLFGMYMLSGTDLDKVPDMEKRYLFERYYQLSKATGQKFDMDNIK